MFEKSMLEAAEEEKQIAVEKGLLHDGVPAMTVVLDSVWSKRTHKHSYNAMSDVATVIRQATGKILHPG